MTSKVSKLAAIVLVAIVVAAGLGYWMFAPKMSSPLVTYTTQQTSLLSSSPLQTSQSLASSTTSTSAPATTLWISVTAAKPVSYYISMLKSAGAQPYVELGWQLQALPDATNATTIAKITYLALNATNPEVKEAFQLMMKGGTPHPTDFTYSVPNYNTELQVLYWLALQNELKKDDTLALAMALSNGLWVTIGDQQVRDSVKKDTSDLLDFFRETNELQRRSNLPQLEAYPLEALVCLSWVGSLNGIGGPHGIVHGSHAEKVNLKLYLWDTPSIETLRKMRDMMVEKHWLGADVDSTVANVEEYFYFSGIGKHWSHATESQEQIEVDGEMVKNWEIYNVDFYFRHYVETGKGQGDCGDETAFVDAWLKSWGIASNYIIHQIIVQGTYYGHAHIIYYEPQSRTWRAYRQQLRSKMYYGQPGFEFYTFLFKPPVTQPGYFSWNEIKETRMGRGGRVFVDKYDVESFRNAFQDGVPTVQMKQWLLYS